MFLRSFRCWGGRWRFYTAIFATELEKQAKQEEYKKKSDDGVHCRPLNLSGRADVGFRNRFLYGFPSGMIYGK